MGGDVALGRGAGKRGGGKKRGAPAPAPRQKGKKKGWWRRLAGNANGVGGGGFWGPRGVSPPAPPFIAPGEKGDSPVPPPFLKKSPAKKLNSRKKKSQESHP